MCDSQLNYVLHTSITLGTFRKKLKNVLSWLAIPYVEVDTSDHASVPGTCARATLGIVPSGVDPLKTQPTARLLLANGGFELWARRTNRNGIIKTVTVVKNPPASWADVIYEEIPPYRTGANPAEPRFWDLCLFTPADIAQQNIGYNASRDGARIDHVLHKIGSLLQCDPVHPRAQGISLTRHGLGRGGTSGAAARIEFVKSNDTAALMSENGAVASMVPNALHIARAWVRCVKGSATVALVVSSLPERARQENTQFEPTLKHYDSLSNVSIGAGGPNNVLHCKLAPSTYASDRDASETQSQWTELAVGVMSSKPEHEVSVQLVVQSHSDDAAILADDVSFETKTSSAARASTPSDGSIASIVFSTQCSGGGGAEVSFSDSHRCSSDPTYLFYRIREKGGVPVAYEQVHAMVTLGYKAIKCRKPDIIDDVTKAQCPHLSQATLPHLSAMDVKRWGRRGHNDIYPLFHIHFLVFSMLEPFPCTNSSGCS